MKVVVLFFLLVFIYSCDDTSINNCVENDGTFEAYQINDSEAQTLAKRQYGDDGLPLGYSGPYSGTARIEVPSYTSLYSSGVFSISASASYSYVINNSTAERLLCSVGTVKTSAYNTSNVYLFWQDTGSRAYVLTTVIDTFDNPIKSFYITVEGRIKGDKGFFDQNDAADEVVNWQTSVNINK